MGWKSTRRTILLRNGQIAYDRSDKPTTKKQWNELLQQGKRDDWQVTFFCEEEATNPEDEGQQDETVLEKPLEESVTEWFTIHSGLKTKESSPEEE